MWRIDCEREDQLNDTINKQKSDIYELKKKLKSDPTLHNLQYLEDKIDKKIDGLKDLLVETVKHQLDEIEKKTYASVASGSSENSTPHNPSKEAIFRASVEFKAEEDDKKKRAKNIIVHGVNETDDNGDQDFAASLIGDLHTTSTIHKIIRFGITKRKDQFLSLLNRKKKKRSPYGGFVALKSLDRYKWISVTEDLTPEKQMKFKELSGIANEQNAAHICWVRGCSKTDSF